MCEQRVNTWLRPEIRTLSAYKVPQRDGYIKLDAMENPYAWPERLREPWLDALRGVELNRYPDPEARRLKARLRGYLGVPQGVELLLGNGSDELIQMVVMAVAGPGRCILTPTPSFAMYSLIAQYAGLECVGVPLRTDGFGLDLAAMLESIERHTPALIFLAYPNNPTGNLFERDDIEQILAACPGLVVIDEAYFSFAQASFLDDLERYDNLLVLRTLSKIGLAGLRVGIMLGPETWLTQINKLRLPYNLGVLSQVSADFMLIHTDVLTEQIDRIRADRDTLFKQLDDLEDIKVWPSKTNFLTLKVPTAINAYAGLLAEGLLVKDLGAVHPLLEGCIRVTVGTQEENQRFLQALRTIV